MLHIFIPATSSTYTSSTSTSFTRYFFDLLFGELFPPSVSAEGACAWLEGGGVAGARPLGQLQAAVELVGAVMAKLGRLLAGPSLSYLLGVLCWIGATLQAMLDTSEATGPLRGLRNTLYSTLATFYSKFEGFEVGEVEGRAVCRVFLWRALPTFHTEFIHSSSGLLTLLLAWSRSKVLRRLLLLTHPDTGHNLLHTVCKVLNKTGASTKVIDSVLDIVHNLVREEEEEEGEEQAGALATSEGMAMVVAEMAPILAHFRSWIEATNANLKRLARVGVKLDILAAIAPHITGPADALELFKQLIVLSNSLKKAETVAKVLGISKLLMVHIEGAQVAEVVQGLVPFFGRLASRQERQELAQIFHNAAQVHLALTLTSPSRSPRPHPHLALTLTSHDHLIHLTSVSPRPTPRWPSLPRSARS